MTEEVFISITETITDYIYCPFGELKNYERTIVMELHNRLHRKYSIAKNHDHISDLECDIVHKLFSLNNDRDLRNYVSWLTSQRVFQELGT